MLDKFFKSKEEIKEEKERKNYEEAQKKIADAMSNGEFSISFPCDEFCFGRRFSWWIFPYTIEQLRLDNFDIKEQLPQNGYITISWN